MIARSLEGLKFRSVEDVQGGDVSPATVFDYSQDGDMVHARYAGGSVRLGFLVGTRDGDRLEFRYTQLRTDGTTASGQCQSRIVELPDGRLRMEERWRWTSHDGAGESVVEQVPN